MAYLGQGIQFIVEPSDDHLCPICTEPLMEPYLTDCGHHFCYTCRGRLLASGTMQCPQCREPDVLKDARLNKHLQRQVNGLKVRCQYHEVGCEWVGELLYLQEHLDPEARRCDFVLLPCSLGCGERVRSSAAKEHMLNNCSKRLCTCQYCGYYYNKRDIVTEKHYPLCEQFPVECPNKCSVQNLKRIDFKLHLKQCPLQVIECLFSSAGCMVQLPRREMEAHEQDAVHKHLRMVMSLLQSKPTQEPSTTFSSYTTTVDLEYIFNLPPVEFTISDFLKMKESNAEWISPPFYTHPHGYKLCLVVYPNGLYRGRGTHMSVFLGLLEGKYDNCLSWPMELSVIVQLLNWRKDDGHHEWTVTFNSNHHNAYNQVTKEGIKLSPVYTKFIDHSTLSYRATINTEYLRDDCLRLNVAEVAVHPTHLLKETPSWQDPHNISQSVCEFTLSDFSKRKQMNNIFFSPPFYTHKHGYKLCLRIHANGYGDGNSTHVSVGVVLISGEYDDQLRWPFVGDVVVGLQNWKENKGHYKKTIPVRAANGFNKVTEGVFGAPRGIRQFIAHSSLPYNSTSNTEYLQTAQDCLKLRVYQVIII